MSVSYCSTFKVNTDTLSRNCSTFFPAAILVKLNLLLLVAYKSKLFNFFSLENLYRQSNWNRLRDDGFIKTEIRTMVVKFLCKLFLDKVDIFVLFHFINIKM